MKKRPEIDAETLPKREPKKRRKKKVALKPVLAWEREARYIFKKLPKMLTGSRMMKKLRSTVSMPRLRPSGRLGAAPKMIERERERERGREREREREKLMCMLVVLIQRDV